ncbi:MAG: hypothetical protein J3Q66DRAFT_414473 [Benniella sp.]|nr:MAG: hypothetical protein J3Q66DRAFT_414473 [Benniella sp.]
MLGIQGLDDLVCLQLARQDLVQCAQVSKKWHSTVTPHLWRDLSWLSSRDSRYQGNVKAFCTMLIEDCLAARQCHKLFDDGNDLDQALPSPPLPPLSVNGHWIETIPGLSCLYDELQKVRKVLRAERRLWSPTPLQLYQHLIECCSSDVQVDYFQIELDALDPSQHVYNSRMDLIDFTIPRLRHLSIRMDPRTAQEMSRLMGLMDQCSSTLETLYLGINISWSIKKSQAKDEPKVWVSLKELTFQFFSRTDTDAFWPWLFKRCRNVERMTVYDQNTSVTTQSLAKNMFAYMPILHEITLEFQRAGEIGYLDEHTLVTLLTGSRKGWKTVKIGPFVWPEKGGMDALAEHFPTLEHLETCGFKKMSSNDIVQVLRSCRKLKTFKDVPYRKNFLPVDAKVFMDLDPDTGFLRPWNCERSLKVLKLTFGGIPKLDSKEDYTLEKSYTGQGRDIQGLIYERLARLINLETLWLGGEYHHSDDPQCLEMSLESGLYELFGLKRLTELSVTGLPTRIGVREVQWMTKHWPRLRVIRGLGGNEEDEAAQWLRENHPEIRLPGDDTMDS